MLKETSRTSKTGVDSQARNVTGALWGWKHMASLFNYQSVIRLMTE